MKLLIIALLLTGCGGFERSGCYAWGDGCRDETPRDPETQVVEGPRGEPGISCSVEQVGEYTRITCGEKTTVLHSGRDGAPGESIQGPPGESIIGPRGEPGESVTGQQGIPGESITGQQGIPGDTIVGPAGADAIIEVIDPCGPNPDGPDEVLFRLSSGEIVAWYKNLGLSVLGDGNYITTDNQRCYFSIHSNITTW